MNQEAVNDLVRFALVAASRLDQPVALGPIHLMKLLYLADWEFAKRNHGETLTNIPWRFHHFGPYCDGLEADLERAVGRGSAADRSFLGVKSGKVVKRWEEEASDEGDEVYRDLEYRLPHTATSIILQVLRVHGNATNAILHEVYGTLPMRCSAPGEGIDFSLAFREMTNPVEDGSEGEDGPEPIRLPSVDPGLTKSQLKKRGRTLDALKAKMEEARQRSRMRQELVPVEVVEDDVFLDGLDWLDGLADSVRPFKGVFNIDSSIWHSSTRRSAQ